MCDNFSEHSLPQRLGLSGFYKPLLVPLFSYCCRENILCRRRGLSFFTNVTVSHENRFQLGLKLSVLNYRQTSAAFSRKVRLRNLYHNCHRHLAVADAEIGFHQTLRSTAWSQLFCNSWRSQRMSFLFCASVLETETRLLGSNA